MWFVLHLEDSTNVIHIATPNSGNGLLNGAYRVQGSKPIQFTQLQSQLRNFRRSFQMLVPLQWRGTLGTPLASEFQSTFPLPITPSHLMTSIGKWYWTTSMPQTLLLFKPGGLVGFADGFSMLLEWTISGHLINMTNGWDMGCDSTWGLNHLLDSSFGWLFGGATPTPSWLHSNTSKQQDVWVVG